MLQAIELEVPGDGRVRVTNQGILSAGSRAESKTPNRWSTRGDGEAPGTRGRTTPLCGGSVLLTRFPPGVFVVAVTHRSWACLWPAYS